MSLASLHGKVVLLTFLDPVCTSDCPLIAQEFRDAGSSSAPAPATWNWSRSSPTLSTTQVAYTQAFDRQERLTQIPNWLYLTGSVPSSSRYGRTTGSPRRSCPPAP